MIALPTADLTTHPMATHWNDSQPIYSQLKDRTVAMILDGTLPEGEALPPFSGVGPVEEGSVYGDLLRGIDVDADGQVFVLDGRIPDEGACVELGIAYGQKYLLQKSTLLIGLHTDWRWAFPWARYWTSASI